MVRRISRPVLVFVVILVAGLLISSCSRDPLSPEEKEIAFYDAVVSCTEEQTGQEYGDVTRLGDTDATDAALADADDIYSDCFQRIWAEHPEWRVEDSGG